MNCMRCGTEINGEAIFCDSCLAEIKAHPIKPGTPINLPRREKQQAAKRTKKRQPKPEEQLVALRRLVAWLVAVIIVLAIALSAAVYLLLDKQKPDEGNSQPGQNYGTSAVDLP